MSLKTMANYLPEMTAQYPVEYDFVPQIQMPAEGDKNQILHRYDDRTIRVVNISNDSFFYLTWQFRGAELEVLSELMDLYFDVSKANKSERSWYWRHPLEDNVYVVRFISKLPFNAHAGVLNHREVPSIEIQVEGVKVP